MMKVIGKLLAAGLLLLGTAGANAALVNGNTYELFLGQSDNTGRVDESPFKHVYHFENTLDQDVRIDGVIFVGGQSVGGDTVSYKDMFWDYGSGAIRLTDGNGVVLSGTDTDFSLPIIVGPASPALSVYIWGSANNDIVLAEDYQFNIEVSSVPVPGAAILFGSAVMAFGFISRRRKGIAA
ncbi:MAG: hypothetical protein ABW148_15960 [Sedimenticola sp.]